MHRTKNRRPTGMLPEKLSKYNAATIFTELSDLKEERQKQSKRKSAFESEQPSKKTKKYSRLRQKHYAIRA